MKTEKTILTAGPSITRREIAYVLDAVEHGWNEEWNKYIQRFEDAFAEQVGVEHALSTSSCTEPTFLPAWRFAGSVTLSVVRRGVGSTPRSAGFMLSIGFLRAFMMLGSEA